MQTFVQDTQVVPDLESTLFETLQQGLPDMLVILINQGINTINYRYQTTADGITWTDLGTLGTDVNNTLSPGQVKTMKVSALNPKIRLVGNASGGAVLNFSITRYFSRVSGGPVPIINL